MIKNINDILSLIVLVVMVILSIKTFGYAFIKNYNQNEESISKLELFRDYIDNEEE